MSLTRKALAAMGIEEEKIDQIIEMHTAVTTELKTELDKAKADADKLPIVQKELNELREEQAKDNPFEVKYNAIKEEFETYKNDVEAEKSRAKKVGAFKDALKEAGVSEKRIDSVAKVSTNVIDAIEFDDEGNVKDADKLKESIQKEWAGFIVTENKQGATTPTPPSTVSGGNMSRMQEVYKKDEHGRYLMDSTERQKAIAEMITEGDE